MFWLTTVTFSPDGNQIATGSHDESGKIAIWDAHTGKLLRTLSDEGREVTSLAYHADSARLLAGFRNQIAILYDTKSGTAVCKFRGHTERLGSVAFSPNGRFVLTGSWDGTAIVWDARTGARLLTLISRDAAKTWVVYASDGHYDGSEAGRKLVTFRAGDTDKLFSEEQMGKDFYRPGILGEILNLKRGK